MQSNLSMLDTPSVSCAVLLATTESNADGSVSLFLCTDQIT